MVTSLAGISSTAQTDGSEQTEITENNEVLGKDAFLDLLITQLRNQDPLKPMKDKEFVAQMAQFSSLEQMQNMNKNMEEFIKMRNLSEGASLIGKTVEKVIDSGDNGEEEVIKGKVKKIVFENGETYARLSDSEETKINVNDITSIY